MSNKRNRTSSEYIGYGVYLYFLGLSTRNVAKALSFLHIVKRSHLSIWKWIQTYKPAKLSCKRKKISEFVVDETIIQVGSEFLWLWAATEPKNKRILALSISKERNMFVAERFLSLLIQDHGKHLVSTDGRTWYPQACRFLKLRHHLHSPFEKSIIERTMQYIKDRIESFDDYFPCNKENCNLDHVKKWLNLFSFLYNKNIINA
jgi:putative transposase